jgi:fucose permease
MGACALAGLAPALLAALTPAEAFPVPQGGDLGRVALDPVVLLAAAVYFLYVPIELTVRNWTSAYLSQEGYSEARAGRWLLAFWISFLAGRLATAWLVDHTGPTPRMDPWLVVGLILLVSVALGNLAGAAGRYNAGWGLPFVALFMGPILPTLIGIVLRHSPQEPGTGFGTLYALGTLGTVLLVPVIGPYTRGSTAFRVPLLLALAASVAALALALTVR